MKPYISIFVTALIFSSCTSRQVFHPGWQDNFYKYRNTNAPNIPAENFFRLNSSDPDTTISNLLDYPKTEIINVNSSSIKHIPTDITKLKELKALNITWTDFTKFPAIIFDLPGLISLDIAFRDTTIVVDTLCNNFKRLQNLEMLSLISCGLSDLPYPITDMKRLKYLSLGVNHIKAVTTPISKLDSLIEIDFSENQLTNIPEEISSLKNLEILDFCSNNISTLPNKLLDLKNIRELNLMNNKHFKLTLSQARSIRSNWKKLETIYLVGTNHLDKEIKELNTILPGKLVFDVVPD